MNPSQQPRVRAVLLVVCVPVLLAHGLCTFLMVFPLVSLLGGNWNQSIFLLWWLAGTAGLVALVYSSATFGARRLRPWQVMGLVVGMLATLPAIIGFFGEWWISASALLAACIVGYTLLAVCLAGYILISAALGRGHSNNEVA
jgi:hypothetical protein